MSTPHASTNFQLMVILSTATTVVTMSAIHLIYRDSRLDGMAGDEPVRLALPVRRQSGCRGTSIGQQVDVSWSVGDNHKNLDPVSELRGTSGGIPVVLAGNFHLTDYYAFRYGDITGSFGDDQITAHIASVEAPASAPATISIDGMFGDYVVLLYASIEGDLGGGRIEGLIGDRTMRLTAAVDQTTDNRVVQIIGEYDGPSALLNLLAGSLVYFL